MLKCTISKVRAFRKLTRQLCATAHPFFQEYQMLYDPNNDDYPGKMYIMAFPNAKGNDLFLTDRKEISEIKANVAAVTKTFKQMKFDVSLPVEIDITKAVLKEKLETIAAENLSKYSSLICMFTGHGTEDSIEVGDGLFKVDDIFKIFHKHQHESLIDKPKIFIFDACRGDKNDELVEGASVKKAQTDCKLKDESSPTTPTAADYLICYAATKGYVSFLNENGSLYIQELTKILEEYFQGTYGRQVDLLQVLTKVSAEVATKSVKMTADNKNADLKQMPCFVSSLRKQLYLPTTSNIDRT